MEYTLRDFCHPIARLRFGDRSTTGLPSCSMLGPIIILFTMAILLTLHPAYEEPNSIIGPNTVYAVVRG